MNKADLLQSMMQLIFSGIAGLLIAGVGALANVAATKVRHQTLAQFMYNIHAAAINVVKALRETHTKPHAHKRPLSPTQAKHVRNLAVQQVKHDLGPRGLKDIQRAVGKKSDLDALIQRHIEAALCDIKHEINTAKTQNQVTSRKGNRKTRKRTRSVA